MMSEWQSRDCPFVPAEAGTQAVPKKNWIPAFVGMNGVCGDAPHAQGDV